MAGIQTTNRLLKSGASLAADDDGVVRLYRPRRYFQEFHNSTQRFAVVVAHRRCGKTVACLNDLIRAAIRTPDVRYGYIAPTYSQAKSVAFDLLIATIGPMIERGDATVNKSELRVNFYNGSQIRLFGADNYNALRGLYFNGVVLDEFADFDPSAWKLAISPTLSDRRGFAVFIGTPRGHNEFYDLYTKARSDPEWFVATLKASELVPFNDKLPPEVVAKEHWLTSEELEVQRRLKSEEQYNQEYECDFEAAIVGAYYGKYMADAERDGRLSVVDYDPGHQVYTAWDIGGDRDATAIWFVQLIGRQICVIDYHEGVGADSAPYAKAVLDKPYSYAGHFLPHDAGPNRVGIDKSYRDFLTDHGLRNITILPVGNVQHGINLVRLLLPRCHFDQSHCHLGIEALKMYRAKFDEKNKTLSAQPIHDWSSHGADAFRYLAVGLDKHIAPSSFNRKIIYPRFGMA